MSTPHEKLIRTKFALPLGEVHALVGGAVSARPLLFLHGFPDHPPTAVPFLEHLAETHRVVAPWLRGYAPSPIVGPYDLDTLAADALALIDRLGGQVDLVGHDWGGEITYTVCAAAPSHVRRTCVARSRSRFRTRPPSYARSPTRSSGRRAGTWACSSSQERTISCADASSR